MLRNAVAVALIAGMAATYVQGQSAAGAAPAPATAQTPAPPQTPTPATSPAAAPDQTKPDQAKPDKKHSDAVKTGKPIQADTIHAQRKAAKLYLEGVQLLEKQRPEAAWALLKQAVEHG